MNISISIHYYYYNDDACLSWCLDFSLFLFWQLCIYVLPLNVQCIFFYWLNKIQIGNWQCFVTMLREKIEKSIVIMCWREALRDNLPIRPTDSFSTASFPFYFISLATSSFSITREVFRSRSPLSIDKSYVGYAGSLWSL